MNRKVILYIATSLDGYIARKSGEVDFLKGDGSEPGIDIGYNDFYKNIDTVIMGNKTYSQIMGWGEYPYKGTKGYVYTRKDLRNDENVTFTNEDPKSLIEKLKSKEGKDIWLIGGANILDSFIKEDLVDEYIIAVMPIVLGSGIPLFKENEREIKLKLKESKAFDGIVQNHYVKR
ncbi:dihydrofolate reductase family protein [Clostridium oceanicum]|uniref:Dihydrofolate reductase family protein n=1 Tax=Clostridium oceanicum TaxID=1543 RepID=A0ABP3UH60_9CLOT